MSVASKPRRIPWPRLLRQIHLWLGVFFAPAILFFAVTGGLQELKLHEAHGDYTPAPIVEKLGQVHIHQKFAVRPQRQGAAPARGGAPAQAAAPRATPPAPETSVVASRWFFTATAVGLVATTLLGLWIGVVQARQKTLALILLGAGSLLPVALLAL
ncbi:MAG: hypothetical protein GC203_17445 [Phenylobacterium sp.]|uniref:hypothetical protein n=1 Tax=Phenylobacterium sp. TaxID=1871053 RepID=UPI0025E4F46F|nr:hypothetical protein [Phenylobacterium sp.]MBI1199649.1 hypothetical protein [Phenylobacterium sp.]